MVKDERMSWVVLVCCAKHGGAGRYGGRRGGGHLCGMLQVAAVPTLGHDAGGGGRSGRGAGMAAKSGGWVYFAEQDGHDQRRREQWSTCWLSGRKQRRCEFGIFFIFIDVFFFWWGMEALTRAA
mmetsp:Transcript_28059/g.45757  ORF Transcript_28059/g.45757 Transcript_28059/m.45757 type:complete len:124 (-) Transcript_28059:192-563(-)